MYTGDRQGFIRFTPYVLLKKAKLLMSYTRALYFSTYRQEYMSYIAFAGKMFSSNQGCVVPA